jgi:hypothetical protein
MTIKIGIPEITLAKLSRASDPMAVLCSQVRLATDPAALAAAEKTLAVSFLLEVHAAGREAKLGISPEESNGLAGIVSGKDYPPEPPPPAKPAAV